jgi:hypothetical protein
MQARACVLRSSPSGFDSPTIAEVTAGLVSSLLISRCDWLPVGHLGLVQQGSCMGLESIEAASTGEDRRDAVSQRERVRRGQAAVRAIAGTALRLSGKQDRGAGSWQLSGSDHLRPAYARSDVGGRWADHSRLCRLSDGHRALSNRPHQMSGPLASGSSGAGPVPPWSGRSTRRELWPPCHQSRLGAS